MGLVLSTHLPEQLCCGQGLRFCLCMFRKGSHTLWHASTVGWNGVLMVCVMYFHLVECFTFSSGVCPPSQEEAKRHDRQREPLTCTCGSRAKKCLQPRLHSWNPKTQSIDAH